MVLDDEKLAKKLTLKPEISGSTTGATVTDFDFTIKEKDSSIYLIIHEFFNIYSTSPRINF